MKKFYYSIFVVLVVWQALADDLKPDDWDVATNNFKMSIALDGYKNAIKANQPCILLIRYRNISTNETFWVYERNGIEHDPDYSFAVISPSGKNVSPDMKHVRHGDSGGDIPVPPGQSIEIKFNLSELCRFDEAGTYKIIAKKGGIWGVEEHQSITVASNPLNIIVSDK